MLNSTFNHNSNNVTIVNFGVNANAGNNINQAHSQNNNHNFYYSSNSNNRNLNRNINHNNYSYLNDNTKQSISINALDLQQQIMMEQGQPSFRQRTESEEKCYEDFQLKICLDLYAFIENNLALKNFFTSNNDINCKKNITKKMENILVVQIAQQFQGFVQKEKIDISMESFTIVRLMVQEESSDVKAFVDSLNIVQNYFKNYLVKRQVRQEAQKLCQEDQNNVIQLRFWIQNILAQTTQMFTKNRNSAQEEPILMERLNLKITSLRTRLSFSKNKLIKANQTKSQWATKRRTLSDKLSYLTMKQRYQRQIKHALQFWKVCGKNQEAEKLYSKQDCQRAQKSNMESTLQTLKQIKKTMIQRNEAIEMINQLNMEILDLEQNETKQGHALANIVEIYSKLRQVTIQCPIHIDD